MKQISTKISSFTLAFLVLFSTFSFTVDTHYCGDFLVDISFTGESDVCGMSMGIVSEKKSCCKDEVHQIEGQDELQTNKIENITFENQQFLAAFLISFKDLFIEIESKNNFYNNFSPPDISFDYQISYQSFLI
jgi:hypothetical protein